MNNTKWDELRIAMYELGPLHPRFQVKTVGRDELSRWDGEWFYHFREGGYEDMQWVDIRVESDEQREAVRQCLVQIHLPGIATEAGFRIYGWLESGESAEYIV